MPEWSRRLREQGVVGLNERNLEYINRANGRRHFPLVDDKLRTKRLAQRYGVAVPELLGVIRGNHEVRRLEQIIPGDRGFAIKPARGSGGKGILVIASHGDGWFRKGSGEWLPRRRVVRYLSNLLAGLYTLGGTPDVAMVEALVEIEPEFAAFSHAGVPDIRIVVYQGYPVMAMMRLSTAASDGKANLHQNAIGVGLDIARGEPVHAVQKNRRVSHHPDTGQRLDELRISDWEAMLIQAANCFEMTGLGFLGADMVLDRRHGPLLLELNARPGLSIQLANGIGLAPRLQCIRDREAERVEADRPVYTAQERVAFARARFTGTNDVLP
ncbi:alpha-L-glutamate ligase-like protein [Halofilum ochraceum]|uniref:alpha-L-glutamate ligase-like protein n=1 Tax=Halofilum ochraceum TaxID=1611323 RepID=UPI0008311761|nr:alpha-L-glutamate ligase-like protein [Halofilum ochraceum]